MRNIVDINLAISCSKDLVTSLLKGIKYRYPALVVMTSTHCNIIHTVFLSLVKLAVCSNDWTESKLVPASRILCCY